MMVKRFAEVCRRRGLKVNAGKSKVMVLNGEEGLECEVHVNGICLEYISEFKYLGGVLEELGTDGAECNRKVESGRRDAGAIKSLVNGRDLQLECARVFSFLSFTSFTVTLFLASSLSASLPFPSFILLQLSTFLSFPLFTSF